MTERIPQGWGNPPEDYDLHWGQLNCWAGRRVLDIGADVGSTADYFLQKGAIQVIAVEPADRFWPQLFENSRKVPQIMPVKLEVVSPAHVGLMLDWFRPDIVKMDCEGCEVHLFNVPDHFLKIPNAWAIEAHSIDLLENCEKKLVGLGFEVKKEFPYLNVFVVHMEKAGEKHDT